MEHGRRRKGFRQVGQLSPRGMGLPIGRARELRAAHAWISVAGEAVARRARAWVQRGVLEVEVAEPVWHQTLEPMLPELAWRLAAAYPELGVVRYRLRTPVTTKLPPARSLPADAPELPTGGGPEATRPEPRTGKGDLRKRLESLGQRYLERSAGRTQRDDA